MVIVDDLSNAKIEVIDRIKEITGKRVSFYWMDCADKEKLWDVFRNNNIDAVIHFAGFKAVGESVKKSLQYYRNNLDSTLSLVETMEEFGCRKLVFSSSATVYGPNNPHPYVENCCHQTSGETWRKDRGRAAEAAGGLRDRNRCAIYYYRTETKEAQKVPVRKESRDKHRICQ